MTIKQIKKHLEKQIRISTYASQIAKETSGYDEVFFIGKKTSLQELQSWINGELAEESEDV
jgi:cell division protein FtsX